MFGFGIGNVVTKEIFNTMPRIDQNKVLQSVYDKGYSAKEMSKFFDIPVPSIYSRITAKRGRGPQSAPAT